MVKIGVATAVAIMIVATVSLARTPNDPIVIHSGGTYSGAWVSTNPRFPAVLVKTSEPVIIENASISGPGHLIASGVHHTNITVRNVRARGVNPNVAGRSAGRFVTVEQFDRLVVENCYLESTAGIYALDYAGDRTAGNSIRIVRNRAKNIDGRKSDGKGGYQDGCDMMQFVQFDKVRHLPGIEIAWNEVSNEPGVSRVEDNISIYLSSGTSASPIRIHDNFIRGAFPARPEEEGFSGGGIMLGDGVGKTPDGDSAFVEVYQNHVLDTANYGIAISAGHDSLFHDNRIVSAGVLASAKPIRAQNVGAYIWDSYKAGKQRFYNNSGRDNVIGWVNGKRRNDWWIPDARSWTGNKPWPGEITLEVYQQEHALWEKKCAAAGVTVGPVRRATIPTSTQPATSTAESF